MYVKICCQRDTTNEEEQGVQAVGDDHEDARNRECFVDCTRDEVEQGQHREDGNKHDIIYDGGIARGGVGDDVADKCQYEERPEEL